MLLLADGLPVPDCGVIAISAVVCTMAYVRLTIHRSVMRGWLALLMTPNGGRMCQKRNHPMSGCESWDPS